ncbi:MAG: LPS assembly lipoprotein LptE [Bdellovibrionaceae bacterium]|nr:LPS assembly lipoprotein LptE [Pseudobdellovibrionaceae bacterium]
MKYICFFIFLMGVSGCGYQLGFGHRALPEGVKSIYIPIFINDTFETGSEVYFANALREEIVRSKIARVVNPDHAEAQLQGRIVRVDYIQTIQDARERDQLSKDSGVRFMPRGTVLTTEYLVRVTVEVQMLKDNKVVWKQWLRDERLYDAPQIGLEAVNTANTNYNHSARQTVLKNLAQVMMHELYGRLTESF